MNYDKLLKILEKQVTPNRYKHILGVISTSQKLSKIYFADYTKCSLAAIFHDWCKNWSIDKLENYLNVNNLEFEKIPLIYHGIVSFDLISKTYPNLVDNQILEAIKYHTSLCENPNIITQILFIADYIEPSRVGLHYDKIRNLIGKKSLDEICIKIIKQVEFYLKSKCEKISINSINYLNKVI